MRKCYQELVSLTQLFLFREYPLPKRFALLPTKEEENETRLPSPPPISASPQIKSPSPAPSTPTPLVSAPAVLQEKKEDLKEQAKKWELEPLKEPFSSLEIEEFWTLFPTLFPHIRLSKSIPSDNEARKINTRWLNEQEAAILILSFGETESSTAFLKKMAQGISERLASARVLSVSRIKEEEWPQIFSSPSLRLIIASDYALYTHPPLMHHYREQAQPRKVFLFNKPLLLLSDPSLYIKEPQLKALLWKTICNEFASI